MLALVVIAFALSRQAVASSDINVTGKIYSGGNEVCTASNGLCGSGTGASSAGGWTNTSTTTSTGLDVNLTNGNLNFRSASAQKIVGSRVGNVSLKLEFPDNGADYSDGMIIGSTSGSQLQVSSRAVTFGSLSESLRSDITGGTFILFGADYVRYAGAGSNHGSISINDQNKPITYSSGVSQGHYFQWHPSVAGYGLWLQGLDAGGVSNFGSSVVKIQYKSEVNDDNATIAHYFNTNATLASPIAKLFAVANNGAQKFAIDAAGNVGIGTTNPDYAATGMRTLTIAGSAYPRLEIAGSTGGQIDLGNTTLRHASLYAAANGSGGKFGIRTANAAGNLADAVLITSEGNVGIGTTAPSAKLEIIDSSSSSFNNIGHLKVTGTTNIYGSGLSLSTGADEWASFVTGSVYGPDTGKYVLAYKTSPLFAMTVDKTGHVSINDGVSTGTGTDYLTVQGNVVAKGSSFKTNLVGIGSTWARSISELDDANGLHLSSFGATGSNGTSMDYSYISTATGNPWLTPLMAFRNNSVGIGTTVPAYKLDVNGTSSFVGSGRLTAAEYGISAYSKIGGTDNLVFSNADNTSRSYFFQGAGADFTGMVAMYPAEMVWANAFTLENTGNYLSIVEYNPAKGFAVRAAVNHTANIQEWQNSSGDMLLAVNGSGTLIFRNPTVAIDYASNNVLHSTARIDSDLGFMAQSQGFTIGSYGTVLNDDYLKLYSGGSLKANGVNTQWTLDRGIKITTNSGLIETLVIKANTSQTANLTEWRNSAESVLAAVNGSGAMFIAGSQVCTVANGLCGAGSGYQSSAGGWTNTSITTSTALNVNISTGNLTVVNGNLGIGTSAPSSKLSVEGNIRLGEPSATPSSRMIFGQDATGTNIMGGNLTFSSGNGTGNATGSSIIFQTPTVTTGGATGQNQTTRLTIGPYEATFTTGVSAPPANAPGYGNTFTWGGNTGIVGWPSTGENMAVKYANNQYFNINYYGTTQWGTPYGGPYTNWTHRMAGPAYAEYEVNTVGGNVILTTGPGTGNATGSGFYFQTPDPTTNGTTAQTLSTKMTISGIGNVGIGTTSPGEKIHVSQGNIKTVYEGYGAPVISADSYNPSGFNYGSVIQVRNAHGTLASPTVSVSGDILGYFTFSGYGSAGFGSHAYISAVVNGAPDTQVPTDIVFGTGGNTLSASEKVRITSAGNVGIGTATPTTKLDVNGSMNITGNITIAQNSMVCYTANCSVYTLFNGTCLIEQGLTERRTLC